MALTVSTDLTNITTAETYTGWNDVGGGSGGAVEPDFFVQGSNCVSRPVSGASASRGMMFDIGSGNELDFSSGGAEEDMLVYMWVQVSTPALADNVATAPGLTIRLAEGASETTDYGEWDIVYSDLLTPAGTDAFRMYVLDPRSPPTRTNGTWDYNNVRHFGAILQTNATAKGRNLSIDRISYGLGEIIVTGTATDAASGLQEMVDWDWGDINQRWGILQERSGVAFCKGKLVIGDDSGTLSTTFTAQDTVIAWEDTFYYDGTRIRPAVGYDDSQNFTGRKSDGSAYYGIDFRGNGTGDTDVTLGALVGSDQGRSGPTLIGSEITATEVTCDDGAVEDVAIYGTTFDSIRAIDLSSNASTDDLFGNTFKRCGSVDVGPVEARNNNFIAGIGGAYTFYETFENLEGAADEQLSTADPTTEWTDLLNGANLTISNATSRAVQLNSLNTQTNITILDDDKVGSDDHYVDCVFSNPVVFSPANQGTMGPVIACDSAAQDYFYMDIDIANDQVSLIRCNAGTDTTIDGPDTFTMDTDEEYIVLLRRSGTTIEGFISGNSAADGIHTTKLSATDSAHTGTTHRRVGIRGDASTSQTGTAPQISRFGAGPITDNLGQVVFPATASNDVEDANFINCSRALSFDTAGAYTLTRINLSGNLADAHNDSGGSVTGSFIEASVASNSENTGSSTSEFTADVATQFTVQDPDGNPVENVRVLAETADNGGGSGLPFEASISITSSLGTATVTHTSHGLATNDYVAIRGAQPDDYNKVAQITVTGTNTYTYSVASGISSPATGTPIASYAAVAGLTNASGVISSSKTWPASQGLKGWARKKNASSPFFKDADINVTDASGGTDLLLVLQLDE